MMFEQKAQMFERKMKGNAGENLHLRFEDYLII